MAESNGKNSDTTSGDTAENSSADSESADNASSAQESDSKDSGDKDSGKKGSSSKSSSRSRGSGRRSSDSSKGRNSKNGSKSKDRSNDSSDDSDTVQHEPSHELDDPLGKAYDLECGSPLEDAEESLPWNSDVDTPKEFFSTEILYRFDILTPAEQEELSGRYLLRLKGAGNWTVDIDKDLSVSSEENTKDSDLAASLSLTEDDFLHLVNGRLNPQLAVLADKIHIKGDIEKAMSFQSLLIPSAN